MKTNALDPQQKALRINLDAEVYGTFAELGAGQEVVRCITRAGGGAGTIARAVGAFGPLAGQSFGEGGAPAGSRQQLESILDHEYQLLSGQLDVRRGGETAFFVFADTLAGWITRQAGEVHGWLGIRFQSRRRARPSQIAVHVRFRERDAARPQEVLGALGVNLVYGARHFSADPDALLLSLVDNLEPDQVAIDQVEFSGPAFAAVDNDLLNRKLVEHGLTGSGPSEAVEAAARFERPGTRRSRKPVRGGLMDSVHLAGMPKAA